MKVYDYKYLGNSELTKIKILDKSRALFCINSQSKLWLIHLH